MDIKEVEITCSKCEGKGLLQHPYNRILRPSVCDKCFGYGSLDWIENVVGKKTPELDEDFFSGIE